MKKVRLKIIVSVICCFLFIALILCGVAVTQSKNVILNEAKKELLYASQKYANQFNTEFGTHEKVVDLMCTIISANFTTEEYRDDRGRFLEMESSLREVIKDTIENIQEVQSLYFTFNPDTAGANDELWFLKNKSQETYQKEAESKGDSWLVNGSESDAYYFEAIRNGRNWSGVEYDKYINDYSVTYSRGCWDKNGELIGVMGSDIMISGIFNSVKNIEMEEGGYAFLIDGTGAYLAGSESEEIFKLMKKKGILNFVQGNSSKNSSIGIASVDGIRYFTAYATTSNGWVLALVQNEKALLQSISYIKQMLFSMAGLILFGVFAYSYYFFKKSIAPLVEEFEIKDIIMLHQSRQAKLGEMVGNIAHQWKQPLNVMNIVLSNLWDDYSRGDLTKKKLEDYIRDLRSYIQNMSSTVDDFAGFLKPAREKEKFSVEESIDTALCLMQESIKINRISINKEIDGEYYLVGYKNEFIQGIFNILNNARDAIMESNPDKREITLRLYSVKGIKEDQTILEIMNNGNKIPDEILSNLFKPYYTTKEAKGGTGIGLYLTKDIIESHFNGSIHLFNVENGVCVRIMIPGRKAK